MTVIPADSAWHREIDVTRIRQDFSDPHPAGSMASASCFLDSAASAQKPARRYRRPKRRVYETEYAKRPSRRLLAEPAARPRRSRPGAREEGFAALLKRTAEGTREIRFRSRLRTRSDQPGCAKLWAATFSRRGTRVLITHMEHHANIRGPWADAPGRKSRVVLKVAPIDDAGELDPGRPSHGLIGPR